MAPRVLAARIVSLFAMSGTGTPLVLRRGTAAVLTPVRTAAVLTPVTGFKGTGYAFTVGDGTPGPTTLALRRTVLDLQYGRTEDRHGWLHRVM